MSTKVATAFEPESHFIEFDRIRPLKHLPKRVKKSAKYIRIAASIREIGIIEPPVVARDRKQRGEYLLLDGHLRIDVLKDQGEEGVTCLIATDDEAFTYNKWVSRLATMQEHKMILKAIERGVSQERIAKALNVSISTIQQKRALLNGICAEVAELFKDRHVPVNSFRSLKRMKPLRQIEVAELMIAMDNYSVSYSKALLAATPREQLVESEKPKRVNGVSAERVAQMESEMAKLQRELKLIEDCYGPDHLNLVLARGYLATLLKNRNVERYLSQHHAKIVVEFRRISEELAVSQTQQA